MQDLEPIDVEFIINNDKVKADAKKVRDEITMTLADIGKSSSLATRRVETAFQRQAKEAKATNTALQNQKRQYDGLGNSISQLARELPAFTFSAQTGFLAISNNLPILADEINRLKIKNEELVASGQKGKSVFGQVAKSLLSWNTVLSVGITLLTVYGPQIAAFINGLFRSKSAIDENKKSVEALNKAYESNSYQKGVKSVVAVRAAFAGAGTDINKKKEALALYNKELGSALGTANSYNAAEKTFRDKSEAYVKALLFRAAATEAVNEASKELIRLTKEEDEVQTEITAKGGTSSATAQFATKGLREQKKEIQKEAADVETTYNRLITKLNAKADALKSAFSLNFDGDNTPTTATSNARKKLLQKIADLDAEYARKRLDSDAAEVQALKDKFSKIRKLVEDFNRDPKTKVQNRIDLTAFNQLEQSAVEDLNYKQQTSNLKEELANQKQLYQEFEEYKKQFGIQKAKEQYADLLKEYDSYSAFLQAKYADNAAAFNAYINGTATGAQNSRVSLIIEEAAKEKKVQETNYQELLASLQNYEQKRKRIITDYQAQRAKLLENGNTAEAEQLKRNVDAQINELDEGFAKNTDEYKALIAGVENLSRTAARTVITNARKMVTALQEAGKLSAETAAEINKKIDDLENNVNSRSSAKLGGIASGIFEIAGALQQLGASLESYNEGLADTITTMGELGNVAGDAVSAVAKFSSGDILGGISSAIGAISGVFSIGARARESARQAQAEIVRLQQVAEDGERRLNEILRQRNIERSKEVELTLEGLEAQKQALKLAQTQAIAEEATLLKQLQQEQFIESSRKKKYGGFLGIGRKTKVVNEYGDLLGLTFEEIEALYEKGKLTERAQELFDQLRDLREEGEDINGLLSDLETQANEIFTGTTSNAISDSIIQGLKDGKTSLEDFAGDVEGFLQNAVLNGLKYTVLEEPIRKLYEQFAADAESDGGLNTQELQAFRDRLNETMQNGIDKYTALTEGLDLDALDKQGAKGLQAAIRRELTEETASELTGLSRGQFDITKRHFQLHEKHFLLAEKHHNTTLSIMGHTALIEQHTRATVETLITAVVELKAIKNNVKPSQNGRDLGKTGG
ncbi:hypothetical protein [Cellulophaga lytica]|uniref:hypothetical protein n=1 Tax=Cellulophaga lytica TaxID=979 RepID=UPI003CE57B23